MNTFKLLLLFLFSFSIHAQIASSSLFKEMRAQNSAVISQRPAATFSLAVKKDMVEKVQDTAGTAYTNSKSDIDITNTSFFYGGKGGGFTSEVWGEMASGSKDDDVTIGGTSATSSSEADMTLVAANFGIMKFLGLGVMRISEERTQTTNSGNGNYDTEILSFNIGFRYSLGLDFGFFYQPTTFSQTGTFAGESTNLDIDMPRIGFGVGKTLKSFHFEVGYVKDLEEIREDQGGGAGAGTNVATYNPAKVFSALEFRLKGIMLGITSNYYMDGFFDFNNIMYYTMVLSANKENRLENTFNFSLGGDKGHSFSGSVSYSTVESQELPPTLASGTKLKTTSTIKSAQLSYTYNW